MTSITLTRTRIRNGLWEGLLQSPGGGALPAIEALHEGRRLEGLLVAPAAETTGQARVSLPLPADLLSEGVQTILFRVEGEAEPLARVTLVVGVPLEDDIRAEVDLLRAELDLVKQALRRTIRNSGA